MGVVSLTTACDLPAKAAKLLRLTLGSLNEPPSNALAAVRLVYDQGDEPSPLARDFEKRAYVQDHDSGQFPTDVCTDENAYRVSSQ